MARTTSAGTRRKLYQQESDLCIITLLEFTSNELSNPIYLCDNNESVTHNSNVYQPYAFTFILPPEEDSNAKTASLTIDNVDRTLTIAFRSIRQPLNLKTKYVDVTNPNVVEIGPFDFTLKDVEYNLETITLSLEYLNYIQKPAGTLRFSNLVFPGLYA